MLYRVIRVNGLEVNGDASSLKIIALNILITFVGSLIKYVDRVTPNII